MKHYLIASTDFRGLDEIVEFTVLGFLFGYFFAKILWNILPNGRRFYGFNWVVGFISTQYICWALYSTPSSFEVVSAAKTFPNVAHSYPITINDNVLYDHVFNTNFGTVEEFQSDSATVNKIISAYQLRPVVDSTTQFPWSYYVTYGWHLRNILKETSQLALIKGPVKFYSVKSDHNNILLVFFPKTGQCLIQSFFGPDQNWDN